MPIAVVVGMTPAGGLTTQQQQTGEDHEDWDLFPAIRLSQKRKPHVCAVNILQAISSLWGRIVSKSVRGFIS